MEAAVGDGDLGEVPGLGTLLLLLQELFEPLDERGGRGHGAADGELLDEQTGLHDVGDLLGGDGEDEGALLRIELEQPFHLQLEERLADRCPGHPHGEGEFPFGEERAPLVAPVEYGLLDVHVDAVGCGGADAMNTA